MILCWVFLLISLHLLFQEMRNLNWGSARDNHIENLSVVAEVLQKLVAETWVLPLSALGHCMCWCLAWF